MTPSSGDVFVDLGFSPFEAAHLTLRTRLMDHLEAFIADRGMTQRQAGRFFGMTQPRISNLVRGRIDLFSLDMLVEIATRAGMRVELTVRPGVPHHADKQGRGDALVAHLRTVGRRADGPRLTTDQILGAPSQHLRRPRVSPRRPRV